MDIFNNCVSYCFSTKPTFSTILFIEDTKAKQVYNKQIQYSDIRIYYLKIVESLVCLFFFAILQVFFFFFFFSKF
jgi:hypothetical protein